MKTAVQKILVGKDRKFNSRFMEMCSRYLFEPIVCTPAASWEKGQVENQVDTGRRNFFTPLRCVNSLEEINEQLQKECMGWAQKSFHPEFRDRKVWDVYQDEKLSLLEYRCPFAAYKIESATVSAYSLVNHATNMYSVDCNYVDKVVEVRIYAKKIVILFAGKIIGEHARCFERYKKLYDPWHYVPALERKPGALRNGAPFKQLKLPQSLISIREAFSVHKDGDKQFIQILLQVLKHGLEKVDQAYADALKQGISNANIIIKQYLDKPNTVGATEEHQLHLVNPPSEDLYCYNKSDEYQEASHVA